MQQQTQNQDNNRQDIKLPSKKSVWLIIGIVSIALFFSIALPNVIAGAILGVFGLVSYPLFFGLAIFSFFKFRGRKITLPKAKVTLLSFATINILFFLQILTSFWHFGTTFSDYIKGVYDMSYSMGGVVMGTPVYGVSVAINPVFAAILFFVITTILIWVYLGGIKKIQTKSHKKNITDITTVVTQPSTFSFQNGTNYYLGEPATQSVIPQLYHGLYNETIEPLIQSNSLVGTQIENNIPLQSVNQIVEPNIFGTIPFYPTLQTQHNSAQLGQLQNYVSDQVHHYYSNPIDSQSFLNNNDEKSLILEEINQQPNINNAYDNNQSNIQQFHRQIPEEHQLSVDDRRRINKELVLEHKEKSQKDFTNSKFNPNRYSTQNINSTSSYTMNGYPSNNNSTNNHNIYGNPLGNSTVSAMSSILNNSFGRDTTPLLGSAAPMPPKYLHDDKDIKSPTLVLKTPATIPKQLEEIEGEITDLSIYNTQSKPIETNSTTSNVDTNNLTKDYINFFNQKDATTSTTKSDILNVSATNVNIQQNNAQKLMSSGSSIVDSVFENPEQQIIKFGTSGVFSISQIGGTTKQVDANKKTTTSNQISKNPLLSSLLQTTQQSIQKPLTKSLDTINTKRQRFYNENITNATDTNNLSHKREQTLLEKKTIESVNFNSGISNHYEEQESLDILLANEPFKKDRNDSDIFKGIKTLNNSRNPFEQDFLSKNLGLETLDSADYLLGFDNIASDLNNNIGLKLDDLTLAGDLSVDDYHSLDSDDIIDFGDVIEEYQADQTIDKDVIQVADNTGYYNFVDETDQEQLQQTSRSMLPFSNLSNITVPQKTESKNRSAALKKINQTSIDDILGVDSKQKKSHRRKRQLYVLPSTSLLVNTSTEISEDDERVMKRGEILVDTLNRFGIPVELTGVVVSSAVTRYELSVPSGVSVRQIDKYADDIKYELACEGNIRIETPIPGKKAVGVEVPNENVAIVGIKSILESRAFIDSKHPLTVAIGKDVAGNYIVTNLAQLPHLLIAGATGMGKSVGLNSIITSLLYKSKPDECRIILIDPKQVEFNRYSQLPNLMLGSIINEPEHAINALDWAIIEMERRYSLLKEHNVQKITEYLSLESVKIGESEKLPYIVIIVDELADLIASSKRIVEEKIRILAAKARAAGIHLVLATQRPTVDVITGTLKANLPSRMAFRVFSGVDSRTILDSLGAETLVGRGDMLFISSDTNQIRRIQGAYISNDEVESVVKFLKAENEVDFDESVQQFIMKSKSPADDNIGKQVVSETGMTDPFFQQVLYYAISKGQISISKIQAIVNIGYAKAQRIMTNLEKVGYVSEGDGAKPRNILISMEEFYKRYPNFDASQC